VDHGLAFLHGRSTRFLAELAGAYDAAGIADWPRVRQGTGVPCQPQAFDCRDQLEVALGRIASEDCGLVLYLRQEGRGIGLLNKMRAYGLQDRGLDTVEANLALGFRDDEREYSIAAHMLHTLNVRSIRLLTNNPKKVGELARHGVRISDRVPHVISANEFNRFYLDTKRDRSGHILDASGKAHLPEQGEAVQVEGTGLMSGPNAEGSPQV